MSNEVNCYFFVSLKFILNERQSQFSFKSFAGLQIYVEERYTMENETEGANAVIDELISKIMINITCICIEEQFHKNCF